MTDRIPARRRAGEPRIATPFHDLLLADIRRSEELWHRSRPLEKVLAPQLAAVWNAEQQVMQDRARGSDEWVEHPHQAHLRVLYEAVADLAGRIASHH